MGLDASCSNPACGDSSISSSSSTAAGHPPPSSDKLHNKSSFRREEFQVSNVAAFEAASREITRIIEMEGCISSAQCGEIMQEKSRIVELVNDHFPHSYSTSQVIEKVMEVLRYRDYTPENTIFAHSVCPDAINHAEGSITNVFSEHMGEVFQLGGLAGIPFCGKPGFNGFAHQAPDNGHCFVLLAPHVGMDAHGTLGRCDRTGEEDGTSGSTCASAVDAFNYCCTHEQYPNLPTVADNVELTYLIHQLGPRHKLILAEEEHNAIQAELTRHCHEIAKGMLDTIVHTDFGGIKSTLVVLTGIQINMPDESFEDFFQPLCFYVIDTLGRKRDLFVQTFGHLSPLREKMKEKSTLMFFCT